MFESYFDAKIAIIAASSPEVAKSIIGFSSLKLMMDDEGSGFDVLGVGKVEARMAELDAGCSPGTECIIFVISPTDQGALVFSHWIATRVAWRNASGYVDVGVVDSSPHQRFLHKRHVLRQVGHLRARLEAHRARLLLTRTSSDSAFTVRTAAHVYRASP